MPKKHFKMKLKFILIPLIVSTVLLFNDKPAYKLFDNKGKEVKYKKMLDALSEADIVLFGEIHNNPICHWLEYEILKDLHKIKKDIIVGAEMFESDNQLIINEYLDEKYEAKKFEDEMKLWPNYKTDYKPLVELVKENKIPLIATNVPRRYANVVYQNGFEGLADLDDQAKKYIADLPVKYDPELKCYKDMLEMGEKMGGHSNPNLPKAQAIKDATMAQFILKNWKEGQLFIHYHGAYHSDNYQGIAWYLLDKKPDLKIMTISSQEQSSFDDLDEEHLNVANFIIAIPNSMTKTK